jgi:uncharacterized protein YndB with AHSA1/START domain
MAAKTDAANPMERTVVITRIFDAPRHLMFKMWTDPVHLAQWWGPSGFTNPVCEIDARPGGAIRIVMRAPDGVEHGMKGVFREVVEPEGLAFTNIAVDQAGNHMLEGFTTVTFVEQGSKTRLTVETSIAGLVPEAVQMLKGMEEGWSQSLVRLAALVASAQSAGSFNN